MFAGVGCLSRLAAFGAVKSWQWQLTNGPQSNDKTYDASGRLIRYRLGNIVRDLTYDAANRITGYKHFDAVSAAPKPELDQAFGYDELGRLTQVWIYAGYWSFSYDANGNRTSSTVTGNTSAYAIEPTSNRITSITNPGRSFNYDAAGNTTADSQFNATYDLSGRMNVLTKSSVSTAYAYDGMGRRVRKFSSSGAASTVVFIYDLNGQLLGEYDQAGNPLREFVWLGSTPIAVFTPDPANSANPPLVFYIHADHIDTPRVVVDKNNQIRWRWMAEPFGIPAAETNPSGLGTFAFNLRFPGQYFDQESGLHYNWWRYYAADGGRYTQFDPIGLAGGINGYAYVGGNPLMYMDSMGLSPKDVAKIIERLRQIREQMTKDGLRHPDQTINNFCRMYPSFPGCDKDNKYKDCGEQTDYANDQLGKEKYDDKWNFSMDAGVGHAWGIAVSSNPNDPIITYDVRAGNTSSGQNCPSCKGWFGDRTFGVDNPPGRPPR